MGNGVMTRAIAIKAQKMESEGRLGKIVRTICGLQLGHPVRVAIDGISGAGKTTLAGIITDRLRERGRPVIRATIDGFHNPVDQRVRRGYYDPVGYNWDSFDYVALRDKLLIPLGPGGSLVYTMQIYDQRTESAVRDSEKIADKDAVLIFDGVMLFRQELEAFWDVKIFVSTKFEVAFQRAARRDRSKFKTSEELLRKFDERYQPAQRHYVEQYRPMIKADFVIDNNEPVKRLIDEG